MRELATKPVSQERSDTQSRASCVCVFVCVGACLGDQECLNMWLECFSTCLCGISIHIYASYVKVAYLFSFRITRVTGRIGRLLLFSGNAQSILPSPGLGIGPDYQRRMTHPPFSPTLLIAPTCQHGCPPFTNERWPCEDVKGLTTLLWWCKLAPETCRSH